jgi:flagellar assembly protein FliH
MAGIIKASSTIASGHEPKAAAFNFSDMGDRANSYLDQVRGQAEEILSAARSEAEQIRARAQAEGRQAALKAAEGALKTRLEEQLKQILPALENAAQQVVQAKEQWQRYWEQNLLTLAARIAERVIRRELAREPEITVGLVREALELATGTQAITVRLHPDDQAALGESVQQVASRMARLGPVQVVGDLSVTRGGCRVESEFGVIDQQIESQLARIESELAA